MTKMLLKNIIIKIAEPEDFFSLLCVLQGRQQRLAQPCPYREAMALFSKDFQSLSDGTVRRPRSVKKAVFVISRRNARQNASDLAQRWPSTVQRGGVDSSRVRCMANTCPVSARVCGTACYALWSVFGNPHTGVGIPSIRAFNCSDRNWE